MSRLVLDTNCLIQIVSPRSKYHFLWDSFVRCENTLCVSNEIIEAHAKCIVTNDHHYDVLKTIPFPKVEVVSLVDFIKYGST